MLRHTKTLSSIFSLILVFSFATSVFAQEEGTLVADVSVQNAKVVNQEGNSIEIFFEFLNGTMVQSDVHYGVQVFSTDDTPTLVYESVANEEVTLAANEQLHKYVSVNLPEFLDGEYEVLVVSFNSDGLPFGVSPAGKINLEGTGEYVEIIPDSCVLAVDGVIANAMSGIVIEDHQDVSFSCSVLSHFTDTVTVSAATLVFRGSTFGEGVGAFPEDRTVTLEPDEERDISFDVPRQMNRGAYEHKVFFEVDGEVISSPVFYAYNTDVVEADIVNVTLDKESYERGEDIQIQAFIIAPKSVTAIFDVFSSNGKSCLEEPFTQIVGGDEVNVNTVLSASRPCEGVAVSVTVTSEDGRVLDVMNPTSFGGEYDSASLKKVGLIVAIIVILGLVYLLMFRDKKTEETITMGVLFLAFMFFGLISLPNQAEATTWRTVSGACGSQVTGTVSGSTFNAGSNIGTYGSSAVWCTGSGSHGGGYAPTSISTTGSSGTAPAGGGSVTLRAPSSNGNYSVTFTASVGHYPTASGSIGYRVTGATPPAPTASLSASPGTIDRGDRTTLSSRCTNSTSASISQGVGSVSTGSDTTRVTPTSSRTYTLTCSGGGGVAYATAPVTVNQPAPDPTVTFSASPTTVQRNAQTRLRWSSTNAVSCTGWSFGTGGNTSGTRYVTVSTGKTYGVTCRNSDGVEVSASQYVGVTDPGPTVTLSADDTSITEGESTTLRWSSTNADTCEGSGSGFNTRNRSSGSDSVSPSETTTYSVTCTGDGGDDSDTARVTVNAAAPTASLSADDTSITEGESTTLRWSSTNADTCEGSGSGFNTRNRSSGSDSVSPSETTTYSVTCTGDGGDDSDSVTVSVSSPPPPPPSPSASLEVRNTTQGGSWTGSNITITAGDQISLRWSSSNASSCSGNNFSTGGSTSGTQSSVSEPSAGNQTIYTVSCSGSGGSDSDSLRVTSQAVNPSVSSSKSDVRLGESVTISYNMRGNDPSQCTLVGPGVSYLAGSLTQQTGSIRTTISGDSRFTLTCDGGSDNIKVELIPDIFDS